MNYFKKRRLRKAVRHLLHDAKLARHMREDIAEEEALSDLTAAESALSEAVAATPIDEERLDKAADRLGECVAAVRPPRSQPGLRENIEILVVAVAVAMAFRAYFIQPFKIPTGSMQPTLYGIQVESEYTPGIMDKVPFRYAKFVATGDRYIDVKAKRSGRVQFQRDRRRNLFFVVGGRRHKFYEGMIQHVDAGDYVTRGERLATGLVRAGDHIFVDKVRYNFSKPRRGDIIVFTTAGIPFLKNRDEDHYIKRLVGLPGERISIDEPYLMVGGNRVVSPYPFVRMVEDPAYSGYVLARTAEAKLNRPGAGIELPDDQFLPFGDNTHHSLDGRFFGGVDVENMIGPAFAIYWPFGERWGRVR